MKALLFFLLASASLAKAALIAHVTTDRGTIMVDLQHAKAPQAVANFITLAQGTRSRVDPMSGAVTTAPLYIGEKFFRVINDTSFKIAQTGSGSGTNSGGPGFTFRDEFDPTLTHVPYVLSMANGGPNTNGSQIFFTGNATIPGLNNVHTVFGLVTDAPSRAVIDAIHAAGNNGTTITGITFQRTDPAAVAFNEHAQGLPVVTRPGGRLRLNSGTSVIWDFQPPIGTGAVFRVFRSSTLAGASWSESTRYRIHAGIVGTISNPFVTSAFVDDGTAARAFYHLSVANHPGAVAPSDLAGRTVRFSIGGDVFDYLFNAAGTGGTTTYDSATSAPASFPFTLLSFNSAAHDVGFIVDHGTGVPLARYFQVKVGCDSATSSLVSGRHSTSFFNAFIGWQLAGSGTATITR